MFVRHIFLAVLVSYLIQFPVKAQIIALKGMRVIDGIDSVAHHGLTIIIKEQRIMDIGENLAIPAGAEIIDLSGKTLLPGFIDMHAHFWAYDQPQHEVYGKLMIAGGVTTVFSAGDIFPETLQQFRSSIEQGFRVGPTIYTVGPYYNGGEANNRFPAVNTVSEAMDLYDTWKGRIEGIKFYVQVSEDVFNAVVTRAKQDGLIITGHLMSIKTDHALDMGISGLEHGLWTIQELIDKTENPSQFTKIASINMEDPLLDKIINKIVKARVYIDPTITPMEAMVKRQPFVNNWSIYLTDSSRKKYKSPIFRSPEIIETMFEKQRQFVKRVYDKGGLIVTGTDPFYPNTPPGFALHREIIALTEAGLSNMDAIKAATANGSIALRKQAEIGTIEAGKFADLVVIAGEPDINIEEISNVVSVFKKGKIHNTAKLREQSIGRIDIIGKTK